MSLATKDEVWLLKTQFGYKRLALATKEAKMRFGYQKLGLATKD